ncbi:MAG: response regulator [Bryobacteraceae bacterium]|jgi:CheY-like chemotaxis protein
MREHEHPTVLVVKDDPQVRAVLASILQSAGYSVLQAAHGKAALSMLNLHQVQVAVTDLAMPEMDGLELIRLLHLMHPGVRTIAYSGMFGEDMLEMAVRLGASAALTKPFSPRCLLATVEALLQDGQTPNRAANPGQGSGANSGDGAMAETEPRPEVVGNEHPTVLVVEDDPQVRAVLAFILQSAGYGVLEAAHGKVALSMLNLCQVQVVVSDLAMPEMDGLELIRLLHRMHPGVRIIAYSGVFGEDMLNTAVRFGASAALTKPFSPRCLLATVEALLQDGQAPSRAANTGQGS